MTSLPEPLTYEELESYYKRLINALRMHRENEISQIITALGFPQSVADHLNQNNSFSHQTMDRLVRRVKWLRNQSEPMPDLELPSDPFFNKEFFIQRMATGDLKLQDLALMAAPGGIYYLSQMLDLPLTNKKSIFIRNYNHKYYTRDCAEYMDDADCRRRAGQYRDLEIIDQLSPGRLYMVLAGMVEFGHLDLLKIYLPRYLEQVEGQNAPRRNHDALILHAASFGQMDIYQYLISIYPGDHRHLYSFAANSAAREGYLDFFKLFLDDGVDLNGLSHWSHYAARHNRDNIIVELESRDMLNIREALKGAIYGGNMYVLNKYKASLNDVVVFATYDHAGSAEVCQLLYDSQPKVCGFVYLRVFDDMVFIQETLRPDVIKFVLDHFEIENMKHTSYENMGIPERLKSIFTSICSREDPEALAVILDHPNITKHQPYRLFWDLIIQNDPPENVFITQAEFVVEVAQMLVDRGFVFDAQAELERPDLTMQMRRFVTQH